MLQYLVSVRIYRYADVCTLAKVQGEMVLPMPSVVCGISAWAARPSAPPRDICWLDRRPVCVTTGTKAHPTYHLDTQCSYLSNGQTVSLQDHFPLEKNVNFH